MPELSLAALGAIALWLVYLATMSGHLMSMDGLYMERQAYSLLFDQSFRFGTPLWTWRVEPTWHSLYGIGLSLLYLPGLVMAAPLRAQVPLTIVPPHDRYGFYLQELYQDPLYAVGGSWLHPLLAAISAYLVARLVLALGFERRAALWAMALYGLGSSALVHARGDFAQLPEGLLWIATLLAAVRYRDSTGKAALAAAGAAVSLAILTRPVEGMLLVPAAAAIMVGATFGETRRLAFAPLAVLAAAVALGIAGTLFVNFQRFGSPFEFGYPEENTWELAPLTRWLAVLVSPGRGILLEFPAMIFAPLGVLAMMRRGRRWEAAAMAGLALALFINVTTWAVWWGGWCWGLRLFFPALPLLAVFAGIGVAQLGARRSYLAWLALAAGLVWPFRASRPTSSEGTGSSATTHRAAGSGSCRPTRRSERGSS